MNLPKEIRKSRNALGISQTALAEKIGVGQTAVSQWESGSKTPRLQHFRKIAKILNIKL